MAPPGKVGSPQPLGLWRLRHNTVKMNVLSPSARRSRRAGEAYALIIPNAFTTTALKYVNNLRIGIYDRSEQIQLFIAENTRSGRRIRQLGNHLSSKYLHL
jgi:hypothetical protein